MILLDLKDAIEHEAGGSVDSRLDWRRIANDAGRYVNTMHAWRWKNRPAFTLTSVSGVDHLTTPAGFDHLNSIAASTGAAWGGSVMLTDRTMIDEFRADNVTDIAVGQFWAALEWPSQEDTSQAMPPPRIALYPTPTSAEDFFLNASNGWIELVENFQSANVPPFVEPLLDDVARAMTRAMIHKRPRSAELQPILISEAYRSIKVHDGLAQPILGPIRGGIMDKARRDTYRSWTNQVGEVELT